MTKANMAKDYITADQAEWVYAEPSDRGATVSLLTVGGIQVKGRWEGAWGELYIAWAPLLKRDKAREEFLFRAKAEGRDIAQANADYDAMEASQCL